MPSLFIVVLITVAVIAKELYRQRVVGVSISFLVTDFTYEGQVVVANARSDYGI